MPLSFDQFKQLRTQGLSVDQIVKFQGGYNPLHQGVKKFINSAPPSKTSTSSNFMSSLGNTLKDTGIGAFKGAASTLTNISTLGQKSLEGITSRLPGMPKNATPTMTDTFAGTKAITPTNTAQKVGYGAEQVAEFLGPDAMAAKAGKAYEGAIDSYKYGSKVTKALKFAGKSTLSGVEMGGVTLAQTGSPKEAQKASIFGLGIPTAEEAIKLGGKALDKSISTAAEQLVNSAFGRTFGERREQLYKSLKGLPNFATSYLKDGKWFATAHSAMETMQKKILPEAGKGLEKIANSEVGKRIVQTKDIEPALVDGIKQFTQELGQHHPIVQELQDLAAGKDTGSMSWKDAQKIKQTIYKLMPRKAFKTVDGQATKLSYLAETLRGVASKLNDRLATTAKDTNYKKLNYTYSLFSEALQSLVEKSSRKNLTMFDKLAAGSSMAAGGVQGNLKEALAGPALVGVEKLATSVPGALGAANTLNLGRTAAKKVTSNPAIRKFGRAGLKKLIQSAGK